MKHGRGWADRMKQQAFRVPPFKVGDAVRVLNDWGHHREGTFFGFDGDKTHAVIKFGLAGCRRVHMKNTKACPAQRGRFKEAKMRLFHLDAGTMDRLDATPNTEKSTEKFED